MAIAERSEGSAERPATAGAGRQSFARSRDDADGWRRLKPIVLALIVPLLLLAFWQVATTQQWTRLIPTPCAGRRVHGRFRRGRHLRRCLLGDA